MYAHVLALALVGVVSITAPARAQVYSLPTPAPHVSAAAAVWQVAREPLFYAGSFYHATGPTEFFDGRVMVRTGTYKGVPLYENSTIEPYSVVFVPIGGNLLRPYERKRERELTGTVGSRMPSFPIRRDGELTSFDWVDERAVAALSSVDQSGRAQWYWPEPVDLSTVASVEPLATLSGRARATSIPAAPAEPGRPRETTNAGAYVHFGGARFYTSGRAVTHDLPRFTRTGEVGSAGVYLEIGGSDTTIFVEAVPGGPLAPYTRR